MARLSITELARSFQRLPEITQNYQKITRYQGLKRVKKGRVIGNFGKLPGNYQVIQGNYPKLPITRVCRGIPYLVIRNQGRLYIDAPVSSRYLMSSLGEFNIHV